MYSKKINLQAYTPMFTAQQIKDEMNISIHKLNMVDKHNKILFSYKNNEILSVVTT